MFETYGQGNSPVFVESLDAIKVRDEAGLATTPVMIYGDDVTHVVTEEGVAYLYKAEGLEERRQALSAIAGVTMLGREQSPKEMRKLRDKGLVALPEDLKVKRTEAKRSLLAAKNVRELVQWSDGLYDPPEKFKNW
jgi:malonate decarboxylase alpha subunit